MYQCSVCLHVFHGHVTCVVCKHNDYYFGKNADDKNFYYNNDFYITVILAN